MLLRLMRRVVLPVLLGVSLLVSGVAVFLGNFEFPPDEDGITAVPMLRLPDREEVAAGPVPVKPLLRSEVTFRVSLRWLDKAPTREARTKTIDTLAASLLPDFNHQPRPFAGKALRLTRVPLVSAPGFEFVHLTLPVNPDLTRYEQASSETVQGASGPRQGILPTSQLQLLARDVTLIDFHLRGADVAKQLPKIDAFVAAVAKESNALIRSDQMYQLVDAGTFLSRRAGRSFEGIPFAPGYVALSQLRFKAARRLMTEGAEVVGLPELWIDTPDGLGGDSERHLLIAATLQRLVENPTPDAEGRIEVNARELKHPDIRGWATTMLPEHASGKIALEAREVKVEGGRLLLLKVAGDAPAAYCAYAGCDVAASYDGH